MSRGLQCTAANPCLQLNLCLKNTSPALSFTRFGHRIHLRTLRKWFCEDLGGFYVVFERFTGDTNSRSTKLTHTDSDICTKTRPFAFFVVVKLSIAAPRRRNRGEINLVVSIFCVTWKYWVTEHMLSVVGLCVWTFTNFTVWITAAWIINTSLNKKKHKQTKCN